MVIVDFAQSVKNGLFLVTSKFGDPRPTIMLGEYQALAPQGVIEPMLEPGQWHEVWVVISDGCRVWIDGRPAYRSGVSTLDQWVKWKGNAIAHLCFEGFRGLVDYVRVWELD